MKDITTISSHSTALMIYVQDQFIDGRQLLGAYQRDVVHQALARMTTRTKAGWCDHCKSATAYPVRPW